MLLEKRNHFNTQPENCCFEICYVIKIKITFPPPIPSIMINFVLFKKKTNNNVYNNGIFAHTLY